MKIITRKDACKLLGLNDNQVLKSKVFSTIKNYSTSRFCMMEESEVLAKKDAILKEISDRKQEITERRIRQANTMRSKIDKTKQRGPRSKTYTNETDLTTMQNKELKKQIRLLKELKRLQNEMYATTTTRQ